MVYVIRKVYTDNIMGVEISLYQSRKIDVSYLLVVKFGLTHGFCQSEGVTSPRPSWTMGLA